MQNSFYLAWQYLRYNKLRTGILLACITLVSSLPIALNGLLQASQKQLMARAAATPLLIGQTGSDLDLAINSLYFTAEPPAAITMADAEQVKTSGLAQPIPLYVQFHARNFPIVGTSLDYFQFRSLQLEQGNYFSILGDCVLGATIAKKLGLKPGDSLVSSPEALFDIGGIYPLKMRVVGVLSQSYSADDEAIFTDIKTTWVIKGLGHGHQDLAKTGTPDVILRQENGEITANAKLKQYTEITPENQDSFHFHGARETLPVTAIIAAPDSPKSAALLRGRYENNPNRLIIEPTATIEQLLVNIFKLRDLLNFIFLIVIIAALIAIALIFNLSLRLRQREIETSYKLGCSRSMIVQLLSAEIMIILALSLGFTGILTAGLSLFQQQVTRSLISGTVQSEGDETIS